MYPNPAVKNLKDQLAFKMFSLSIRNNRLSMENLGKRGDRKSIPKSINRASRREELGLQEAEIENNFRQKFGMKMPIKRRKMQEKQQSLHLLCREVKEKFRNKRPSRLRENSS